MDYQKPPRSIVVTLGENLREFYSSIHLDRKDRLESLLKEYSSKGLYPNFYNEYEKNISTNRFDLYTSKLVKSSIRRHGGEKEGRVFFLKDKEHGLIYAFTNRDKKFLNRVISPFLNEEFPKIFRLTYSSNELHEVLQFAEEYLGTDLYSVRSSSKRIFGKNAQTRVEYEKGEHPPFELVFEKAREEELWIDWIRVHTESEPSYSFSLSREGRFRFIRGSIVGFIHLLQYLGEIGLKKEELLSDREIREEEDPKPLLLKYGPNVFSEKDNREKLIDTFSKYKRCSYSIVHSGNPHIYMYISDRMDNSSYSIRSVGNSKIMITPQTSSSSAALMRLIDFLTGNFMEPEEIEEM